MEQIDSFAWKEVLIIVITQIVLFVAVFVQQTKLGEKIKLEYTKQSILHQLNEAEYIKHKFEKLNDLFTHLLETKIFVDEVTQLLINDYSTIDFEQKNNYSKELKEHSKNIRTKTSLYIDKETKDLITEYLMSCSTLVTIARNWGNCLITFEKVKNGGAFVHEDGTPVDINYIKNTIPNYGKTFEQHRTSADEYFIRIETALRNRLEVF
jgi:hypothetical protein